MLLAYSTWWKLIPLSTMLSHLLLLLASSWTRRFVFIAFFLLWSRRAVLGWLILFLFAIRLLLTSKWLIQNSSNLSMAHHATLFLIRLSTSTTTFVHTSRIKLSLRISLSRLSLTSFTLQVAWSLCISSWPWMCRLRPCYVGLAFLLWLISILNISWNSITLSTSGCLSRLIALLTIAIIVCISLIRVILWIVQNNIWWQAFRNPVMLKTLIWR